MSLVPTMANALLNCPDLGKYDLSSMREIILGGAASSPELIARLEQAFHCRVQAGYGLTETVARRHRRARTRAPCIYTGEDDRLATSP